MAAFDFPSWYALMGYAGYRGGQRDCARDLGVTREHVRLLRRGEREPGGALVKLCQALEHTTGFPATKYLRLPENVTLVDGDGNPLTEATDYVVTKPD